MSGELVQVPVVTVAAVVEHFGSVLLVKQKQGDEEVWRFPATRPGWGETLPQAVERAARQATGVTVKAGAIIQAYDLFEYVGECGEISQHYVVIDFEAAFVAGDLTPGDEVLDVAWASGLALKSMAVEANTAELLADLGVIK